MALRIIAGELKGRKLQSVHGTKTRPTANRIREAIFNIIAFQVHGCPVLDLFAGTGAFGIEALSRGAESAGISSKYRTKIIQWDLTRNLNCLRSLRPAFNLIFLDPPYNKNLIEPTLLNLHTSQSVERNALIVVEHSSREPILKERLPFEITDQRRYGKTLVTFLNYMV